MSPSRATRARAAGLTTPGRPPWCCSCPASPSPSPRLPRSAGHHRRVPRRRSAGPDWHCSWPGSAAQRPHAAPVPLHPAAVRGRQRRGVPGVRGAQRGDVPAAGGPPGRVGLLTARLRPGAAAADHHHARAIGPVRELAARIGPRLQRPPVRWSSARAWPCSRSRRPGRATRCTCCRRLSCSASGWRSPSRRSPPPP